MNVYVLLGLFKLDHGRIKDVASLYQRCWHSKQRDIIQIVAQIVFNDKI